MMTSDALHGSPITALIEEKEKSTEPFGGKFGLTMAICLYLKISIQEAEAMSPEERSTTLHAMLAEMIAQEEILAAERRELGIEL